MLNSFWGKFGQRPDQTSMKYFDQSEEFFDFVFCGLYTIKAVRIVNDEMVAVTYASIEAAVQELPSGNPVIAAYVTAQARLKLYSYLEQLGERVLYFDTDSVIYVKGEGDCDLECGDYLGDLTDELGSNCHIVEFVSAGPKQYGYRSLNTDTGDVSTVVKIRGFTLNSRNAQVINFESLKRVVKEFVEDNVRSMLTVRGHRIARTAERFVLTTPFSKVYKVCADKRIYLGDYKSLPYGYIGSL
jgi:hypothetical protein